MKIDWVLIVFYLSVLVVLATGGSQVLSVALPIGVFLWVLEKI